jgi:hypothetical protein
MRRQLTTPRTGTAAGFWWYRTLNNNYMALSFTTVQQAYVVLNNIKKTAFPDLQIHSWPDDMARWSRDKKDSPPLNALIGYDKKSDDGWENLVFFVDNPTDNLKDAFKELNTIKSNSSICRQYNDDNPSLWIFGWF